MANLDSRDYIMFSNTKVINIIYDELELFKTTYIRKAYDALKDIVSENINTTANFMFSFIEENLDLAMKDIFKRSYERIEENLCGMTNTTCNQLNSAEDFETVNRAVEGYKDFIEDENVYKVDLDSISEDYSSYLARFLTSRFDAYNSPQIEDQIYDIKNQSRTYIDRMVENIYQEIHNMIVRINVIQKDALKHYVAEYKRLDVKKQNPDNKYQQDFTHDIFVYNGKTIVYQYEGKDYICYVDGVKVNDPSKIMEINRQLQDEFPEAKAATDSMVNHVSALLIDSKQQDKEKGVESLADLIGTGSQSTEVTEIPDWLKQIAESTKPKDDLNNLTLDDYLDEPKKESTPEEKQKIADLTASLEITDDEPVKESTPEEKQRVADLTASLEITDDEPEKLVIKDGDIGAIQERMDQLMKNSAVIEFLELEDKMRTYYNQYKESVEEQYVQPLQRPIEESSEVNAADYLKYW